MAYKNVLIICPICGVKKHVPVPPEPVETSKSGYTAIYIPVGTVCEHEFYAYIDKNFVVRGYLNLDYCEGADEFELKKVEIRKELDGYDFSWENLSKYIKEKDLRTLIYSYYLGYQILLIEDDLEQERFKIVFGFLSRIFDKFADDCKIMAPEKYLEICENESYIIEGFQAYNTKYKIAARKIITDSESECFQPLMDLIKKINKENQEVQLVYVKNWLDYMILFCNDPLVKNEGLKEKKAVKSLLKEKPRYSQFFTPDLIRAMRRRNKIQKSKIYAGMKSRA